MQVRAEVANSSIIITIWSINLWLIIAMWNNWIPITDIRHWYWHIDDIYNNVYRHHRHVLDTRQMCYMKKHTQFQMVIYVSKTCYLVWNRRVTWWTKDVDGSLLKLTLLSSICFAKGLVPIYVGSNPHLQSHFAITTMSTKQYGRNPHQGPKVGLMRAGITHCHKHVGLII
jgi:hypothetical protein